MKILMATDGSECSYTAAREAFGMIDLGKDSTIRILSVAEKVISSVQIDNMEEYLAIAQKAALEAAEEIVAGTRRTVREALGDRPAVIETKAVIGYEKDVIIEEAEKWGADLIVVGSHGRGFLGRMLLGSVSSAVVRHAPCSVMVVRDDKKE